MTKKVRQLISIYSIPVSYRIQEIVEDGASIERNPSCAMDGQLPLHPEDAHRGSEVFSWGAAAARFGAVVSQFC